MALNILVVDDSAIVRAVIRKTLGLAGVDVGQIFEAENGQQGLDVLKNQWVDLIFADINMPVMTGVEMIDRMNAHNLLKTVPVVVVSTDGSATRVEELKAKGVREFVRKPFTPEIIRKVVADILGGEHVGRSANHPA